MTEIVPLLKKEIEAAYQVAADEYFAGQDETWAEAHGYYRGLSRALEIVSESETERAQIADQVRRYCTLDTDVVQEFVQQKSADRIILAVADWIENTPEWVPGVPVSQVQWAVRCEDGSGIVNEAG